MSKSKWVRDCHVVRLVDGPYRGEVWLSHGVWHVRLSVGQDDATMLLVGETYDTRGRGQARVEDVIRSHKRAATGGPK